VGTARWGAQPASAGEASRLQPAVRSANCAGLGRSPRGKRARVSSRRAEEPGRALAGPGALLQRVVLVFWERTSRLVKRNLNVGKRRD
jgi:hypothetical protein